MRRLKIEKQLNKSLCNQVLSACIYAKQLTVHIFTPSTAITFQEKQPINGLLLVRDTFNPSCDTCYSKHIYQWEIWCNSLCCIFVIICNILILFCNNVWCNNQLKFMKHMIRKLTLNRIQLWSVFNQLPTLPRSLWGSLGWWFDGGFEEGKQAEWREGSGLHVSRHIEELWPLKTTYQHWKSPELPQLAYT